MENRTVDQDLAIIRLIRAKACNKIKDLDSGIKNTETRSFSYSLKRILEELDSLEQEVLYIPLDKYIKMKNRFPGCPRR